MRLLDKLLDYFDSEKSIPKNSGDLITELSDGENLVDGKHTYEHAKEKKHDIITMKKCCQAELRTMNKVGTVPAPFYFERVAILSRKNKNYQQEVDYCETYLKVVDEYYRQNGTKDRADVRKGPRYKAIKKRLPKAKKLLEKQESQEIN